MLIASKVVSDVAVVRGLSRAVYASAGWTRGRAEAVHRAAVTSSVSPLEACRSRRRGVCVRCLKLAEADVSQYWR